MAVTVISMLLVDWCSVGRFFRGFLKVFLRAGWRGFFIPLFVVGCGVGFVSLSEYLLSTYSMLEKVVRGVSFFLGGLMSVLFVGRLIFLSFEFLQDRKLIKAVLFSEVLPRDEIARIFSALKTSTGRLQFVQALEHERVTASGSWPSDFKLSVGKGESISALARLEERWLRLDR